VSTRKPESLFFIISDATKPMKNSWLRACISLSRHALWRGGKKDDSIHWRSDNFCKN